MKVKRSRAPGGVVVDLGPKEQNIPGATANPQPSASPAFNLKRILVPIDFSAGASRALQSAVPFARHFDARLCLLYVGQGYYLAPELGPFDLTAVETRARADAAGKLAALASEQVGKQIPVDVVVRTGPPAVEIAGFAREHGADLIIMSTHGYTGLKHVWFGSVTENVVRLAPCPVLVVREQEHEFLA